MPSSENFFCTDLAWEYGIPLVGTATRGDIWFLLEYTGRWGAKAFEESSLPQEVKDHINEARQPDVEVRTLLIKQDQSRRRARVTVSLWVRLTHGHRGFMNTNSKTMRIFCASI